MKTINVNGVNYISAVCANCNCYKKNTSENTEQLGTCLIEEENKYYERISLLVSESIPLQCPYSISGWFKGEDYKFEPIDLEIHTNNGFIEFPSIDFDSINKEKEKDNEE